MKYKPAPLATSNFHRQKWVEVDVQEEKHHKYGWEFISDNIKYL